MAAAAITLGAQPAIFETSTSVFKATKSIQGMGGTLVNGGTNKVFLSFPANPNAIGQSIDQTPVTNDQGQNQGFFGLLAGASCKIPKGYATFQFTSTVGASVLYWMPDE